MAIRSRKWIVFRSLESQAAADGGCRRDEVHIMRVKKRGDLREVC